MSASFKGPFPSREGVPDTAGHDIKYQQGFGGELSSEAVVGVLPIGQNSPQVLPHGLLHEIVSGTTFTAPRALNRRTHVYRIRPSASPSELKRLQSTKFTSAPLTGEPDPNPIRWNAFTVPTAEQDFVDGIVTLCANGSVALQTGIAVHIYLANRSMVDRAFSNADGELLVLPQAGKLRVVTEYGVLDVSPGELALIPRGCKFRVELLSPEARGFVCENYGVPFRLPELGLIGSTGQANAWDFQVPVAAFEDHEKTTQLIHKFGGRLWAADLDHSPFDIVAWRGNYLPCKYDMCRFMVLGAVAFDHAEPSVYCALTSPSDSVAGPNADFMILPPRWLVAEHTFRPATFHRNCVGEFLAVISDASEGKRADDGSLHNNWAPHGPSAAVVDAARTEQQPPMRLERLAFMIESRYAFCVSEYAREAPERDLRYLNHWAGFMNKFSGH